MDACDGFSTTKNADRLLVMPHEYSARTTTQRRQEQQQRILKLPDYAARKKPQRKPDMIQLPLPALDENQRKPGFFMSGEN